MQTFSENKKETLSNSLNTYYSDINTRKHYNESKYILISLVKTETKIINKTLAN